MEERAQVPVSLPCCSNPTTSYWQDPLSEIANLRTTETLPQTAEFVIIGSGISGASIAYNLLSTKPGAKVTLLEARTACSGATGRNGGHTKAASYRSFLDHEQELGLDEAIKIARMEYANIKATHALAREHHIDCASTECDTVDIIYADATYKQGVKAIARIQEKMGEDPAAQYKIYDGQETAETFFTPDAFGSFQYAAGSLSAYAFATGVLKLALERGLNLQTNTPVTALTASTSGWNVVTDRGQIEASTVIVASNGYTAKILPQMQGLIVPLHGQVVAQRPGLSLPTLKHTYSFIYETGYEYMITRPPGVPNQGDIIIGGGLHQLPNNGASRYGNTDDSRLEPTITQYLRDCTKKSFGPHWGADDPAGRNKREWSGIMGATADGLPYVGQLPDMPGVWMSAGFNGHGMVLCLKSAEALVGMMLGNDSVREQVKEWFPQSMLITEERLRKTKFTGRKDLCAPGEAHFGERNELSG